MPSPYPTENSDPWFDELKAYIDSNDALKVPQTRTLAGLDLSADRSASALRTALSLVVGSDVQAYDSDLAAIAALSTTTFGRSLLALADAAAGRTALGLGTAATLTAAEAKSEVLMIALGDETTAITTGAAKVTFRMPWAMTLTAVRASLTTVSSSGLPTFNIKENGTTILSTKITIDANEKTSVTAATPPVISDASLADDSEITIDIDVAGTGAKGPKVYLIGYRT